MDLRKLVEVLKMGPVVAVKCRIVTKSILERTDKMYFYTLVTAVLLLLFFTFVLHRLNGKQSSSMGVDEHFAQEAERVNKAGVLQLAPGVNGPLSRTWNVRHKAMLKEMKSYI